MEAGGRIHWLELAVPVGMSIIIVRQHQSTHGIRCEIFHPPPQPTPNYYCYLCWLFIINFPTELKLIKRTVHMCWTYAMSSFLVCLLVDTRTHTIIHCVRVCIIWLSTFLSFSHRLSFGSGTFMCWLVFAYVVSDFLIHTTQQHRQCNNTFV